MRVVLTLIICAATPMWAAAQTTPATLPANDIIIALGWSGAEHKIYDDRRWQGSLLVAASGGHYWTDHLKTEIEASWSSPRDRNIYQNLQQQGGFTYALADYRANDVRVGVAQIFQFGRNTWVHPYVGIGADVVRRQSTLERDRQSRLIYLQNRTIPVDIPASRENKTTVFAQGVLKTGLKMYVTEHAFFNTELKFGMRRDIDHVVWKFGIGFDF